MSALQTCGPNRRKLNSGRPPLSQDLDQLVLDWLRGRNELSSAVTDRDLQERALDFATKLCLPQFKASPMWLKRWKLRNRVAFRDGSNRIVPVCGRVHVQLSSVSGDSFLSHVDPSEKIKLLFEESSSETVEWPADQVHYDYSTPEHNYHKVASSPVLSPSDGRTPDCVDVLSCFEPSDFLHTNMESLNSLYALEEVVGNTDTSFYVVLNGHQSPCKQPLAGASVMVHPTPGTLSGVADRRSQPIFHLGPKMVYSSVDYHGESSPV